MGQAYEVVAAAEDDKKCRAAYLHCHPRLAVFPERASAAAEAVPVHDLVLCGFPCVAWARPNRAPCLARVDKVLAEFEAFLTFLQHRRPVVMLFENVDSLLEPRWAWVLRRIGEMFRAHDCYRWHFGLLCASDCGSGSARARVYWLAVLKNGRRAS